METETHRALRKEQDHTATRDRIVVYDDQAPTIWARFYEIETNRPFFCGRDGKTVYTLYWTPKLLQEDYPAWQQQLSHAP